MPMITPRPADDTEAANRQPMRVIDLSVPHPAPDEPPKLRIYCPRCGKRFYTRAGRGEIATCYHCKAQVTSTGARSQDPGHVRRRHRAGARP